MLGIKESKAAKIARAVILALFFLWSLIPVYIVINNSIKPTLDITAIPPKLFFQPTLSHFQKAFSNGDFLLYFKNSIIITSVTTLICVLFGAMGAYGLLIMKSRAGKQASSFLLIGKLVPSITILIPFYSILVKLGLHRTYIGVILAHCSLNLPFIVWLILGFMRDIPMELLEAATIDGATRMQAFWKIMMPVLKPALGSSIILTFQCSWNELLYALQLTTMKAYTIQVGISRFTGALTVDWGKCSAAATVGMLPVILIGFAMQKYLVTGMTAGSVKG